MLKELAKPGKDPRSKRIYIGPGRDGSSDDKIAVELKIDPERPRQHEIPRVPPFSGSISGLRKQKNHHVCCTGRDLKTAGPPDRHPNPRTTPSRHSHGKSSCPLFVLLSRQAQLSASSSRCSPCVLLSSRKARTRAPCDREVRSYRSHDHLRAKP